MSAPRPAVFLDRDGVLNAAVVRDGVPHPPASPDDVVVLPGVAEACERLRAAGYLLVVVTNQPDIARGTQQREVVDAINGAIAGPLGIDEVRVCPHDDADGCACRKPQPGMLLDAARLLGIDLPASVLVGDRWRDVEAGRRAGCRTVHVRYDYQEREPVGADATVDSLAAAADWILTHRDSERPYEEATRG